MNQYGRPDLESSPSSLSSGYVFNKGSSICHKKHWDPTLSWLTHLWKWMRLTDIRTQDLVEKEQSAREEFISTNFNNVLWLNH